MSRLYETAIGAAVGIVVSFAIWPPDPLRELQSQTDRLEIGAAQDVRRAAATFADSKPAQQSLEHVRESDQRVQTVLAGVPEARRALRWNAWRYQQPELDVVEDRLRLLTRLYRHIRALALCGDRGEAGAVVTELTHLITDLDDRAS